MLKLLYWKRNVNNSQTIAVFLQVIDGTAHNANDNSRSSQSLSLPQFSCLSLIFDS